MFELSVACICNTSQNETGNKDNLLFSGQILPETNGGLNGAPSIRVDQNQPFLAAVFTGAEQSSAGEKAAYIAASAFRSAGNSIRNISDLESQFLFINTQIGQQARDFNLGENGSYALAACVDGNCLSLANLGACRAYLYRDRKLYLLSKESASGSSPITGMPYLGLPEDAYIRPYCVSGKIISGDQLLLCTPGLSNRLDELTLLKKIAQGETPSASLEEINENASRRTGTGSVTAVLVRFD